MVDFRKMIQKQDDEQKEIAMKYISRLARRAVKNGEGDFEFCMYVEAAKLVEACKKVWKE